MTIKVCVGSSCHLKGSYDVIEAFKEVLRKYDVEDIIELQASFCLGHCAKGVTALCNCSHTSTESPNVVKVDEGYIIHGLNASNVEELFAKEVYPTLNLN